MSWKRIHWCDHYDQGVPCSLAPYPSRTLLAFVRAAAVQYPRRPALIFRRCRLGYGELEELSAAFAAGLSTIGVARGDRVALLLPSCPQFVIGALGIWKAGAIAVPLDPCHTEHELQEALATLQATSVVTLTSHYIKLRAAVKASRTPTVLVTDIKEYFPAEQRLRITATKKETLRDVAELAERDLRFQELLAEHAHSTTSSPAVGPDDCALILMNRGAAIVSKPVMISHRALVATALQMRAWLRPVLDDDDNVTLLCLAPHHTLGLGGVARSLACGDSTALVAEATDQDELLETISDAQPTLGYASAGFIDAISENPAFRDGEGSSIRLWLASDGPLPAEAKRRWARLSRARVIEGYSCAEAMTCTLAPALGQQKQGSVGLPLPDVDIRVVPDLGGDATRPRQVGELLIRGPQVMARYWDDPALPAAAPQTDEPGLRWQHTGTRGYFDRDGYLFLVPRAVQLKNAAPQGSQRNERAYSAAAFRRNSGGGSTVVSKDQVGLSDFWPQTGRGR